MIFYYLVQIEINVSGITNNKISNLFCSTEDNQSNAEMNYHQECNENHVRLRVRDNDNHTFKQPP